MHSDIPGGRRAGLARMLRRRESHLITDAQITPGQDRQRREVIYSVLQFLRVPSLLVAGWLLYSSHAWLLAAAVVGVTFPLPWVAVVIGNGRGNGKDKRDKNVYKPALARQAAAARAQQVAAPARRQVEQARHEVIEHREGD